MASRPVRRSAAGAEIHMAYGPAMWRRIVRLGVVGPLREADQPGRPFKMLERPQGEQHVNAYKRNRSTGRNVWRKVKTVITRYRPKWPASGTFMLS